MINERPSWDSFFMKVALVTAERSTCLRHHVGAVIVRDKRILSGGYNGAPSGHKDCFELGCLRNQMNIPSGERTEVCRAVHSEENALIQAANYGTSVIGATMYTTLAPCRRCAKMICQAKIVKVVLCHDYDDSSFKDLFEESGITCIKIPMPSLSVTVLP